MAAIKYKIKCIILKLAHHVRPPPSTAFSLKLFTYKYKKENDIININTAKYLKSVGFIINGKYEISNLTGIHKNKNKIILTILLSLLSILKYNITFYIII